MADPKKLNPEEEIAKAEDFLRQIQEMEQQLQASGQSLSLTNKNGTVNMGALRRFLKDPKYREFRELYPEETSQIKNNFRLGNIQAASSAIAKGAKLGQGLRLIRKSKKISSEVPQYPEMEARSRVLDRTIARREGMAAQGLTNQQLASANEQAAQTYRQQVGDVVSKSGGQAGLAAAGLQAAANNRNRQQQAILSAQAQARAANEAALSQGLGMEQQQRSASNQHKQYAFWTRDQNLFNIRQARKDRFLDAGLYNTFKASDAIFGDTAELSRAYRENLPGYVYNNQYYEEDDHPLSPVFNNPLGRMQTGYTLTNPSGGQYYPNDPVLFDTGLADRNRYLPENMRR